MAAADSFKFLEQAILENLNCVQEILAIYGAYHVLKHLIKLPMLLKPFYSMSKCKNDLKAKFGSYAGNFESIILRILLIILTYYKSV